MVALDAPLRLVLHWYAIHQEAVKRAVVAYQRGRARVLDLTSGFFERSSGDIGVQAGKGATEAAFEDDFMVVRPLRFRFAGGYSGTTLDLIARPNEPCESGLFLHDFRRNCPSLTLLRRLLTGAKRLFDKATKSSTV
jgi:hypothetical protein